MTLQGRSASCEAKREINKFVKFDRYSKVQIQQVSLLSCALQMEVAGKRSNSPQFGVQKSPTHCCLLPVVSKQIAMLFFRLPLMITV